MKQFIFFSFFLSIISMIGRLLLLLSFFIVALFAFNQTPGDQFLGLGFDLTTG
jgi:hypothetical protein